MKKLIALFFLTLALSVSAQMREHRAVWLSPYLGEWPGTEITEKNIAEREKALTRMLTQLRAANINTIYYHVRSNCDANYKSSFEPWSSAVSSDRGVEPYGDPLEIMVRNAHAHGIEVFAWVNPYRYCNSVIPNQGSHPLNYENSHPEWLLSDVDQTILNPALPEVQQRIADVCAEIVSNYDVDGLVFDDYFYTNGTSEEVDQDLYNAFIATIPKDDPKPSQADWRRANVNKMIALVNKTVKGIKPYLDFGVSPAGVANHPVAAHPELPVCPAAGYQYNGIYSDPIAWMKEKSIDFISPQIYWLTTDTYTELSRWWALAAETYGVPSYTSIQTKKIATIKAQEFIDQINFTRSVAPEDRAGTVFFTNSDIINYREKYNGDPIDDFTNILSKYVWPSIALNPLHPWKGERRPVAVSNLRKEGSTLVWDADPGMRYAVYSIPTSLGNPAGYAASPEYLAAVVYANSYDIADSELDNNFAVAAYDRFGNLYTPYILGQPAAEPKTPVLSAPENNGTPNLFAALRWQDTGCPVVLQISYSADMSEIAYARNGNFCSVDLTSIPALDQTRTIYWRVIAQVPNAPEAASEIRSFTIDRFTIVPPESPAPLSPVISWINLGENVSYSIEVSRNETMISPVFTADSKETQVRVPDGILSAYTDYYIRIKAERGGIELESPVVSFRTLEMEFSAPELLNPAADGQIIHSNEKISVRPVPGVVDHIVELAASSSFPSRSKLTIRGTESLQASELRLSSKALENGKTYYLRTYATYNSPAGQNQQTAKGTVRTFVYSSEAGIGDVGQDNEGIILEGNRVTLPEEMTLKVYDTAGVLLYEHSAKSHILDLQAGVYILRAGNRTLKAVF